MMSDSEEYMCNMWIQDVHDHMYELSFFEYDFEDDQPFAVENIVFNRFKKQTKLNTKRKTKYATKRQLRLRASRLCQDRKMKKSLLQSQDTAQDHEECLLLGHNTEYDYTNDHDYPRAADWVYPDQVHDWFSYYWDEFGYPEEHWGVVPYS
jgi:hypothetical protein